MFVSASGIGNTLEVFDSIFAGNTARPPGGVGQANGGGASVRINGGLNATFKGVTFDGNTIEGTASEQGAGLFLVVDNDGTAEIQNAHFSSNQAVASTGGPLVAGIGLYVYAGGTSVVEVDQVTIVDNLSQTGGGSQFFAWVLNYGWVDVRDLLTTGGHTGAGVSASGDTSVALTNLTVTDNATTGLYVSREDLTADLSFDNSILYGNGVDLYVANLTPAASNNLVGVNPGFVDPAAGNYRLAPGSPAENAGTNSPAAGLGTADCGGGVRVIDGVVDIGAFEGVDLIFSDTFEWQHTNRWSDTVGGTDCIGAPAVP